MPSTIAASAAFAAGRITAFIPWSRAATAIGRAPLIGRISPVRASSPMTKQRSSRGNSARSAAATIPTAIGRSKLGPSFLISAGARLIVVRSRGQRKPLFEIAVVTRSLLSRTAASGRPTTMTTGLPEPVLTSTSTWMASTPCSAAENTRVSMRGMYQNAGWFVQAGIAVSEAGWRVVEVRNVESLRVTAIG